MPQKARGANFDIALLDETQTAKADMLISILPQAKRKGKIVCMGDFTHQIDREGFTDKNNGMTLALRLIYGAQYSGVITLTENYRNFASKDITKKAPRY